MATKPMKLKMDEERLRDKFEEDIKELIIGDNVVLAGARGDV